MRRFFIMLACTLPGLAPARPESVHIVEANVYEDGMRKDWAQFQTPL